MDVSIDLSPLIPLPVIFGLAAAGAALLAFALFRRVRGAVLRGLAFGLVLLALLNPSLRQEERTKLPSVVAVVLDRSASQALADRTAQTEGVRQRLAERLARFPNVDVRFIEAGDDDAGDGTALFSALASGLADVPPEQVAAAILVTDGQVHDIPAKAEALGFTAPVHALITGRDDERDRRLSVQTFPRFGIIGQEQSVTFRVEDVPGTAGARVRVVLRRDGEQVASREVVTGADVTVPVEITHGGRNFIEIEAEPLAGEITETNNRSVLAIEGIRENLRVLLISGEPHAGERTWRNLLKSDAAVDLVHFTILRPPEKQDGTPINQLSLIAFPTRELFQVKIDEFDLIIFDRYQRRTGVLPIIYFDNIARYVRDGGAVLVAAGPDYAGRESLFRTPLASILPAEPTGSVTETAYHARLTEAGKRHPVTRDLPGSAAEPPAWSRWFRSVDVGPVQRGDAVMSGPDSKPLLVLSREGEGRVAMLLSDHAWLWARGFEGGGPHVDLLRRLGHWLMKESDLEEEALKIAQVGRDLVIERQTMADRAAPVIATLPSGETRPITLEPAGAGLWRGTIAAAAPGLYRATDGDLTALANVGPLNPREYQDALSTTQKLEPLARETGGGVLRVGNGAEPVVPRLLPVRAGITAHGSDWIGLRETGASTLQGIRTLPLLAGLLGLALLLGALSLAWWREGR